MFVFLEIHNYNHCSARSWAAVCQLQLICEQLHVPVSIHYQQIHNVDHFPFWNSKAEKFVRTAIVITWYKHVSKQFNLNDQNIHHIQFLFNILWIHIVTHFVFLWYFISDPQIAWNDPHCISAFLEKQFHKKISKIYLEISRYK